MKTLISNHALHALLFCFLIYASKSCPLEMDHNPILAHQKHQEMHGRSLQQTVNYSSAGFSWVPLNIYFETTGNQLLSHWIIYIYSTEFNNRRIWSKYCNIFDQLFITSSLPIFQKQLPSICVNTICN